MFDDSIVKFVQNFDQSLKIVNLLMGSEESLLSIIGTQALSTLLSSSSDKILEKFEKYVKERIEQLEEDKNIDKYYNNLGDNFYSKNYIGFKSAQDLNKFMSFDYNIYKKIFPNYESAQFAIVLIIIICFLILCIIICIINVEKSDDKGIVICISIGCIIYYSITFGYLIYSIDAYVKVNKNPKLNELKTISSDEFINGFIKEFVSICQKVNMWLVSFVLLILQL